jgi:hypothetical protein
VPVRWIAGAESVRGRDRPQVVDALGAARAGRPRRQAIRIAVTNVNAGALRLSADESAVPDFLHRGGA